MNQQETKSDFAPFEDYPIDKITMNLQHIQTIGAMLHAVEPDWLSKDNVNNIGYLVECLVERALYELKKGIMDKESENGLHQQEA